MEHILAQEQLKQEEKDSLAKVPSINTLEVGKPDDNIMMASAKNIFSAAKNALGNFTNFISKKNIEPANEEVSIKEPPKSARSIHH